jgi:hypothetical protein
VNYVLNPTFICKLTIFVVSFIKIRSHRRKFSNSDSVEQKKKKYGINFKKVLLIYYIISYPESFIIVKQLQNVRQNFYDRLSYYLAAYGRQFKNKFNENSKIIKIPSLILLK